MSDYIIHTDLSQASEGNKPERISAIRKKELIRAWHIIDADKVELYDRKFFAVGAEIEVRVYMARGASASLVHAIIWIRDKANNRHYSGYGDAGGGGYDKESAAIEDALDCSGIVQYRYVDGAKGSKHLFGGHGEAATENALLVLAYDIGMQRPVVIKSYA